MRTLVIIPTYNERENIVLLTQQVLALSPEFEVLVIDDNSPGRTDDAVTAAFGGNRSAHLLKRPRKMGLGTAHSAGFQFGLEHGFERIMTMDADFSHVPAHIPALLRGAEEYDMVIGSRYVPGGATVNWGILRKLISRTANIFAHTFLSLRPADCTSAYRMYRSSTLQTVDFDSIKADGYSYNIEFLFRARARGIRVGESPIVFVDRQRGKSKISRREVLTAIHTILRLRFSSAEKARRSAAPA